MTDNFKAVRDPEKRICLFCQKPGAMRWDGGMGGMICRSNPPRLEPITSARYVCEECDSNHKWFDLEEADFEDAFRGPPVYALRAKDGAWLREDLFSQEGYRFVSDAKEAEIFSGTEEAEEVKSFYPELALTVEQVPA